MLGHGLSAVKAGMAVDAKGGVWLPVSRDGDTVGESRTSATRTHITMLIYLPVDDFAQRDVEIDTEVLGPEEEA